MLGHLSPRVIATIGLLVTVGSSLWLSTARSHAHFGTDVLPGLTVLGLGVGMVFVSVSVTAMAGIPASHAGVASGFLMTGHGSVPRSASPSCRRSRPAQGRSPPRAVRPTRFRLGSSVPP